MEEIEEVPRRIALLAVAQSLLAVERRQRRTGTEQADQVETQPRPQHAALFEELHPIDIAAREAEARIGLEFQLIVERLVSQAGMFLTQAIHDQQDRLEQRVLANAPGQRAYSRGCKPMRGFHWYRLLCAPHPQLVVGVDAGVKREKFVQNRSEHEQVALADVAFRIDRQLGTQACAAAGPDAGGRHARGGPPEPAQQTLADLRRMLVVVARQVVGFEDHLECVDVGQRQVVERHVADQFQRKSRFSGGA